MAARDLFAELLPIFQRVLGPDHPVTLIARQHLARWTGRAGDVVAARDLFAELLPIRERVLGPDHPATLTARRDLAYWNRRARFRRRTRRARRTH
ncbi:tetratricopeptide repeat protein [Actinomadura rayongensis]|uniref:Tetratricopeptide repeat protein n=1 Tax=Actinomadura rayongensis TaxID=1429076 RepID=A0A6I4WEW0_9ACTN|nr:tetratricopeptide repeat protein [Actinomadura rayongensis]